MHPFCLSIHPLIDIGVLPLPILHTTVRNIHVHVSVKICAQFSLLYFRVEFLGHMVTLQLTF
jgi:hypothetical protein